MRLNLKYVIEDVDRHGNVRVYYRPPGHTKIRMREKLGTPEFLRELEAATKSAPRYPPNDNFAAPLVSVFY